MWQYDENGLNWKISLTENVVIGFLGLDLLSSGIEDAFVDTVVFSVFVSICLVVVSTFFLGFVS